MLRVLPMLRRCSAGIAAAGVRSRLFSSHSFQQVSVADECNRVGLVDESSSPEYYSLDMDLEKVSSLVRSNFLQEALVKDADIKGTSPDSYIRGVMKNCDGFLESSEVWSRGASTLLERASTREGDFNLFVGGPSIGKSPMVRDLYKRNKDRAVLLNGRAFPSNTPLGTALFDSLPASIPKEGASWERLVANATQTAKNVNFQDALNVWVETIERKGLVPLLLVDEANSVFRGGNHTRDDLEFLTMITKEQRRITAILVSSQCSEPHRLADLGFDTSNLTGITVLGEPEPAHMRKLLMERWGMGPNLADSLMAVYGGHILCCSHMVKELNDVYSEHFDVGTLPEVPPVQFPVDGMYRARTRATRTQHTHTRAHAHSHAHAHAHARAHAHTRTAHIHYDSTTQRRTLPECAATSIPKS
eukprot:TRINITY_DN4583_c0_g1_i3.p1 TRINITY_DN4583_c0_g1~~TRINITY_DN4583_c0_g1_i3.p1  ORF type:complete len:417 (+),score=65.00 TRINITY_DN4583_c0_g1_i3:233-1483(+)